MLVVSLHQIRTCGVPYTTYWSCISSTPQVFILFILIPSFATLDTGRLGSLVGGVRRAGHAAERLNAPSAFIPA